MRKLIITLLVLVCAFQVEALKAQTVTRAPSTALSLMDRWDWAQEQATSSRRDSWVVFSFQRVMCEHCHMGSWSNGYRNRKSIDEIIHNRIPEPETVSGAAKKALDQIDSDGKDDHFDRMITKNMAVLFHFEDGDVTDVDLANMSSRFDFDGQRIFWMGDANSSATFGLLKDLFSERASVEVQKGLVWAMGRVQGERDIVPFLARIADSNRNVEVRKAVVYSIGKQKYGNVVSVLRRVIERDSSREVQKAAIYALGNNDTPEARRALFAIIRDMGPGQI